MSQHNPVQTFLSEAEDLLTRIEEIALELRPNEKADDLINELFRAFHTLKGSGAMFGFDAVAAFTHHVETVLDQAREGRLSLSKELIGLILRSRDQIKALLAAAQNNQPPPVSAGAEIVASLAALLPPAEDARPNGASAHDAAAVSRSAVTADESSRKTFQIYFRPAPELMISGANPVALLNELRALGDCRVVANAGRIPSLEQLHPDRCHLEWDITLTTDKGLNAIKDVFMFVEDGGELRIEPVAGSIRNQAAPAPGPAPAREADNLAGERTPPLPAAGNAPAKKPAAKDVSVRVPAERLDRLVNLVGELVMNQSRLSQVAARANVSDLGGPVEELERLVDELRDNVLGIRMMPIGATFSRFKRLVHDLSAELGKEIDLVTEGEETELDKTVLDQLGDPLVHLIRNSIGHGIESPEARVAAGKPRRGVIRLAAAHVGSNVVITIADDGQGLDPEAIRVKAVEKGLIAADAKLSEREMYDLIFRPGFSTAKQLTSVSGRGVGMDVVKRQFEALRGQVAMTSDVGKGTTLTLTLPLTLAIIDGLLVEIGRDQFIVPMSVVTENVELPHADRGRNNGRNVVAIRGELVPYVRLRDAFALNGAELDVEKIVIARHGHDRVGLVVDRVLGNHQTVIQSLGRFYRDIELVSGATIMGDGRVALILDMGGLVRAADAAREQRDTTISARNPGRSNKPTTAPCAQGALNQETTA
ncbi:MAG: chemotaxis protein CheA [Opitutaceae bacterium]|jgi:two-component system chemotaxis sensor kinase CheA